MGRGRILLVLVALLACVVVYCMVYVLFLLPKILTCLLCFFSQNFDYNLHCPNDTFLRLNNFIFDCNFL